MSNPLPLAGVGGPIARACLLALVVGACAQTPGGETRTDAGSAAIPDALLPAVEIDGFSTEAWTLEARMLHYGVPATVIAVIQGDSIVDIRAVGERLAGSREPVLPATPFMVKSIAKPVTAFAILRLVEDGVLELDAPLDTYLRRWAVTRDPESGSAPPTLRQTLAHRGGFTLYGVPSYKQGEDLPTLLEAIRGIPPATGDPITVGWAPDTRTRYSGGGYSVLQLLLEDVTGEEYPALMKRLVLDPVGMRSSLFYPGVPDSLTARAAVGHDAMGQPIEGYWERLVQMAAGGLVTTAEDLGRFVVEVNRAWRGESSLLAGPMAREMLTPIADGWSTGFEVATGESGMVYSHTGAGDGFRAILAGVPSMASGVVVLTNSDAGGGELRYEVVRSVARSLGWPAFQPVRRDTVQLPVDQLEPYAGRFAFSDESLMVVELAGDSLTAAWGDRPPTRLYPESDSVLFSRAGDEYVFRDRREARFRELVWRGDFGEFAAVRKP